MRLNRVAEFVIHLTLISHFTPFDPCSFGRSFRTALTACLNCIRWGDRLESDIVSCKKASYSASSYENLVPTFFWVLLLLRSINIFSHGRNWRGGETVPPPLFFNLGDRLLFVPLHPTFWYYITYDICRMPLRFLFPTTKIYDFWQMYF